MITIKKPSDGWLEFLGCILVILGVITFVVGAYLFSGWVFMTLWNWLIVAIFPRVVKLNLWTGMGMVIFLSWIASWFKSSNSSKDT